MDYSNDALLEGVVAGDLRAVARLITLLENGVARARKVQAKLFRRTGRALVVGVTGAPGAGKSTLVDQLAAEFHNAGKRVGILAVDPTSPFSGGAVLGDRIRMTKTSESADVFIRSMATRGSLGGIARSTWDAAQVLDAAGFDLVVIETVGVGQAEVDIVKTADTCLVVLVPGMGDSVQAIKAGILEIADVFVINKADRDGADLLQRDLRVLLSLVEYGEQQWEPRIVRTVATSGDGVGELTGVVQRHHEWLRSTSAGRDRKLRMISESIIKMAAEIALDRVLTGDRSRLEQAALECLERRLDPYTAAQQLLSGQTTTS